MTVTTEYDQLVNEHFMYVATDDIDGVMGSLAEHAEHEIVPTTLGVLTDHDAIRGMYTRLFADVKGEGRCGATSPPSSSNSASSNSAPERRPAQPITEMTAP